MFYGWRMVGVAFTSQFIASAIGFYGLARLLDPLAVEFTGGDRTGIALLSAAMSLPGILVGPLIGRAIGRFTLRNVMAVAALVLALGFLGASRSHALWQLMLVYAVALPIGLAALSGVGPNALVANWFARKRPMALGISQFGLSIAGAVSPFFISWTLAEGGWRLTYTAFASIALFTAPFLWLAITNHPAERDLHTDGDVLDDDHVPEPVPAPITMREALATRELWLVGIAGGLCFCGTTAMLQNLHAFSTDAGFDAAQGDSVLAALAFGAALGKLLFGWLGVRVGERAAFVIASTSQAACLAALLVATASFALLVSVAFVFGLALGGVMPAMTALPARLFGAHQFAPIMGYVSPILIPFQILGPPAAAWVNDTMGTYDPAIYAFTVAALVAAGALLAIRMPARAD